MGLVLPAIANWIISALFRVPVSNALHATALYQTTATGSVILTEDWIDSPATIAATTYTIRVGIGAAGIFRMNGSSAGRFFGGVAACTLVAQEIKG